jgi:hypothetical protein
VRGPLEAERPGGAAALELLRAHREVLLSSGIGGAGDYPAHDSSVIRSSSRRVPEAGTSIAG